MIDLQSCCSLPIQFDQREGTFIFDEELNYDLEKRISLADLLPVLLNKSLVYPQKVYMEYNGLRKPDHKSFFKSRLTYDIVYLPAGLLGIEYVKSHIYFSTPKNGSDTTSSDIIEVLYGVLTVIIQKIENRDEFTFEAIVNEGFIVKLKKGEKLIIPKGYYYCFVNTRNVPAIFARIHRNHNTIDYSSLRKEQGLAYYVIRKNARQEVVMNPRYRVVPKIQRAIPDRISPFFKMLGKSPLYTQLVRSPEKFIEIL